MGLYRRGKTYWFSIQYEGKRILRTLNTDNKKLAVKFYAKVLTEIVEGSYFETARLKRITFNEMMDKYLNEHSKLHKAESTYRKDRSMLANLNVAFSGLTLKKVTPPLISDYKAKRSLEGASPATIRNELRMLSHAFNIAMKQWEWVRDNPVSKVGFKELKARSIDRWLTPDEEQRLFHAAQGKLDSQLSDIITLALNTGMSQEEMLKLQRKHIDLSRATITIRRKKTNSIRTFPINATVIELLSRRLKITSIQRNDYVFFNRAGNKFDAGKLKSTFIKTVKEAGVEKFRFHDLRHTFATRLAQRGVDLYKISKLLGHKDISTTQRYAHHYPESLRSSVELLESVTNVLHSGQTEVKRVLCNEI